MTVPTSASPVRQPLGVGRIIGDSFAVLFRHFPPLFALAVLPDLLGEGIFRLTLDWRLGTNYVLTVFPRLLAQTAVYVLAIALIVQAAYDARLKRPLRIGRYLLPALVTSPPIAVILMLISTAPMLTGLVLFSIFSAPPGSMTLTLFPLAALGVALWLGTVFSMTAPAAVVEKAGFRSLARSVALTRSYRLPVLGIVVLMLLVSFLIGFASSFVSITLLPGSGLLALIAKSLVDALGTALVAVALALVYMRLREIKDGVSLRDIAAVFD